MSYYERIQKSKQDILNSHEQIGIGLLEAKSITKDDFLERIKSSKHTRKAPIQANPALIKLIQKNQMIPANTISLKESDSRKAKN
jgi:hypothetical protein